jgi:hypothetical protein
MGLCELIPDIFLMACLNNGSLDTAKHRTRVLGQHTVPETFAPWNRASLAIMYHQPARSLAPVQQGGDHLHGRRKEDLSMNARDLIHLAERIYVITMPETGHGPGRYRIHDEDTFVEQIAQHPSFKGCDGPHASGTYILTFEADTPETEQMAWIAQVLSCTNLDDGYKGLIRVVS